MKGRIRPPARSAAQIGAGKRLWSSSRKTWPAATRLSVALRPPWLQPAITAAIVRHVPASEGTAKLLGHGRIDTRNSGWTHGSLCQSGNPSDLGPGPEGLGPGGSILGGGKVIAAEVKEVVDLIVGGEETLSLPGRLEPLHLPLPSSGRLV
jgi:hypothetical protein